MNMNSSLLSKIWVALVCLFLLAPIVAAVVISFSSASMLKLPPPGFSLEWYDQALSERKFIKGFWLSCKIAAASALLAGITGTLAAIALNHYRFFGRNSVQLLLILPLIVPSIVVGLGLLQSYTMMDVGGVGFMQATLGHTVIGIPYVVYMVLAAMANHDVTLEKAALSLGASRVQVLIGVTLPLIQRGVLAGTAFAFLISFDEVALSLFLTRGDTLPLRLIQHIQYYADPSVASVATLTTLVSVILLAAVGLALRLNNRKAA